MTGVLGRGSDEVPWRGTGCPRGWVIIMGVSHFEALGRRTGYNRVRTAVMTIRRADGKAVKDTRRYQRGLFWFLVSRKALPDCEDLDLGASPRSRTALRS